MKHHLFRAADDGYSCDGSHGRLEYGEPGNCVDCASRGKKLRYELIWHEGSAGHRAGYTVTIKRQASFSHTF